MLKFFFWILLLANAGLFAHRQGYFDTLLPSDREPARISNQLNADKVKVIPPADALSIVAVAAAKKPDGPACTEIGNFRADDARRFESRLAAVSLDGLARQRNIQEVLNYMVYIPPQGGKEGVDKKVEELRGMGIEDFYIIQDETNLRWAISLGVFKLEEGARTHLTELIRRGVRSARIGPHSTANTLVAFQLRGLDADAKAEVEKIKEEFPRQEMRAC
jgi:hypothetical protein